MRSLVRFTGVVAVLTVSSCGKDATAPEPGPPSDVAGDWTFDELLLDDQGQLRCNDYGTLTISRSDASLSGTVHQHVGCTWPGATIDSTGTAPLTGNVGATTIRLTFGDCDLQGDLFHTPIDSAAGTVTCRVRVGPIPETLSGIWSANFQPPAPTVAGTITVPPGDVLAVTGERVRITFGAKDKHGLRWVGYGLRPPASVQDSFAVLDTTFADTISVTVPASWQGTSYMHVWARNGYHELAFDAVAQLTVLDAVRHPLQTVALGVRAADAAYDSARNVMYFTEPDSARVAMLSLNTFTFGSPIPLPMVKRGLGFQSVDLVPGGDTAIVALPDTSQLGVLDRLANTVTTTRISGINGMSLMRVTANRKALLVGQVDSAGYVFFAVVARDLATGKDSIRRDVGQMGHVSATATLWGSPDHSKVLVLSTGAPSCAYIYDATTDTFSSCSSFFFPTAVPPSATTNGDKWLVAATLLDSALNVLATVTPASGGGLSPDGSVAYVSTLYGYNKLALPSGALIERVRLTGIVGSSRITVLPDGKRLFLWDDANGTYSFGTNHATVVDLTH